MRELIDMVYDKLVLAVCILIIAPIMLFGTVEGMIRSALTGEEKKGC